MKKNKKKNGIKKLITILFLVIVLVIFALSYFISSSLKPISSTENQVFFTVKENSSTKAVINELAKEDIIKNADVAYYYVRLKKNASFKAGDYLIDKSWTLDDIVTYLSNAKNAIVDSVSITFTEGEWIKHYAEKLDNETNVTYEELMNYWNDEDVIRSYMNEYPFLTEEIIKSDSRYYLEGYLFPNTYEFYRNTNVDEITRKFLNQTLLIYNEYKDEFTSNEMSIHEIFTLASIVQYEAASVNDMKTIAGVFLNRLSIGMPLQSSVTVCNSMDIYIDTDWRQCEYNPDYDSPYNTYKYYGLTPGPILNPGKAAIEAVLEPIESEYLFFMADVCGDGTVYYAEDYATHLYYVNKYITCY